MLSSPQPNFPQINAKTIYTACQEKHPEVLPYLPPSVIPGLDQATILINNQLWEESKLPDCVTLSKAKFLKENAPSHPTDRVDRTQGQAVYLYIVLYGHHGKSVHIVFDSGATVSLWLAQTILDGPLTTWMDANSPAAIAGIGKNTNKAVTCTVILPGNTINKHTGNFFDYYCKSTMVEQIIPPLPPTDQTQLDTEVLQGLGKNRTLPEDVTPDHFQTEIGGQLQGLIGAKHLPEFPVAIMHLRNGFPYTDTPSDLLVIGPKSIVSGDFCQLLMPSRKPMATTAMINSMP